MHEREVTRVVVFGPEIAELVADLDPVVTVLDVYDSGALTARRERPDGRAVEGRHPLGRVHVVPNGLDEADAGPLPPVGPTPRRSVVLWGNLASGPKRDALAWLVERAAAEPAIDLPGFVEDLPAAVARHAVMVDPTRSGSGLKNKVPEATGLGLAVVSTPLGIEALPHLEDGTHVVTAPDPEGFAAAVLALLDDEPRRARLRRPAHAVVHEHYLGDAVGRTWRSLVLGATTDGRSGHARDTADTPHSIV